MKQITDDIFIFEDELYKGDLQNLLEAYRLANPSKKLRTWLIDKNLQKTEPLSDKEFRAVYECGILPHKMHLKIHGDTYAIEKRQVAGNGHICLSVHYNNMIHWGMHVPVFRNFRPSDKCKTCFVITNVESDE